MQIYRFLKNDQVVERSLPASEEFVLPSVLWGRADAIFTPAYWLTQYWMHEDYFSGDCHRIGNSFKEEVVACLLGGYGIPAEVGLAAFERLRDRGLIGEVNPSSEALSDSLREPMTINGRQVRYRFWSQKARYLEAALRMLDQTPPPVGPSRAIRNYLMKCSGIGPKTASWIVRNWYNAEDVAIIDIHVARAGLLMGLFSEKDRPEQHYLQMESRFLSLAATMGVSAAHLDALIWNCMRQSPRLVLSVLDDLRGTRKEGVREDHPPKQGLLQQV